MPRKIRMEDWLRPQGSKPNLTMQAKDGKATISIFDDIGPSWLGLIGAQIFKEQLESLGDVKEILVLINSNGGDVFEGSTIYNLLKMHPAKVITETVGLAASIASLIFQAGDVRRVAENSAQMIHRPWSFTVGDEDDHAETMSLLKSAGVQSAKVYASRTKQSEEQVMAWMKAETWIWSDTVLEKGFADEIVPNKAAAAKFDPQTFGFKNAPPDKLQALFDEFEKRQAESALAKSATMKKEGRLPAECQKEMADFLK